MTRRESLGEIEGKLSLLGEYVFFPSGLKQMEGVIKGTSL